MVIVISGGEVNRKGTFHTAGFPWDRCNGERVWQEAVLGISSGERVKRAVSSCDMEYCKCTKASIETPA